MDSLSEDQLQIFESYKNKENIFLTGPGGCGKSYLIKLIVQDAKNNGINIDVTALTGCAAILLDCGAKTLHSWSGIGLAKSSDDAIITKINLNKYKRNTWKKTQLLIIDEVSMMSKRLFDLLDAIGKRIRKSPLPFGGIQVIFSGDFYQLPPVGSSNDPDSSKFCFESELWNETFDSQYILDKVFRQKDDTYINILNEVRQGKLYKQSYQLLKSCVGKVIDTTHIIKPIHLTPIKKNAQHINDKNLDLIDSKLITYKYIAEMIDISNTTDISANKQTHEKSAFDVLMSSTQNNKPKYKQKKYSKEFIEMEEKFIVNNSLFDKELKLKKGAQVMCICNLDMDMGICNGSTGVVIGFDNDGTTYIPIVKFNNGLIRKINYNSWLSDNIEGFVIKQIPLILAWAVTIHKSQGATLDCAEIDIGNNVFASGQTYVALSRVKSLKGLYLKSFNPQKINTDKKVIEFYKQFYDDNSDEDQ
jgi:ATP-dependent DNA helicase PIF1